MTRPLEYEFLKRFVRTTEGRYCTWVEWDDGSITAARKQPPTVAKPITADVIRAAIERIRNEHFKVPVGPCYAVGGLHVVHPYVVDGWTRCANCGHPVDVLPRNPPGTSSD